MQRRSLLKSLGLAAGARVASVNLLGASAQAFSTTEGPDTFFNQIGYRPGDRKLATVRGAAPGQSSFRLRRAPDNQVVLEGPLTSPETDAASGDRVQRADFSGFRAPGTYRIEFGGQGTGAFAIGDQVYADALRTAMRGFSGQRCGCAVDLGSGYHHPPCHRNGAYGPSSGKHGSLPNHGGWHDAGDYGRNVVNSGITCGTLLWAWELYPEPLRELRLGMPRQHGNLPEYLEEILWNLGWMQQMQDTDGGVFHKQTSDQFCAFILPQEDGLVSHVIGTGTAPFKSTAATGDFAAVMAIAARCYRPFDGHLADQFLLAARNAWAWAVANQNVVFRNPGGVATGEYGDPHTGDEVLWATAELWRTTGEAGFEQSFLQQVPSRPEALQIEAPSWGNVAALAYWTYLLSSRAGDPRLKELIRQKTRDAAQGLVDRFVTSGYGNTLALADYGWGSNGTAGNQSMLLAIAHQVNGGGDAAQTALGNLHYMLGRNCFGVSWVTHLGTRPFMHPHHRPSAADGIVDPWPGLLSGGPNAHGGDRVADALPKRPPMRMWVDDQNAYSLNEIAINWNAPLVFTLAFANHASSRA